MPPTLPAGFEHSQARSGGSFQSLVAVLHAAATARGQPTVLSPAELAAYSQALSSHRVADRLAVAAELLGEEAEAAFWRRLPATLQWLAAALQQARRRQQSGSFGSSSAGGSGPVSAGVLPGTATGNTSSAGGNGTTSGTAGGTSSTGSTCSLLWDERLELAEAVERSGWHEQMNRRIFEDSEGLQVGGWGWGGMGWVPDACVACC